MIVIYNNVIYKTKKYHFSGVFFKNVIFLDISD